MLVASVSVIAIHAVGSDNIELPETDTTATEAAKATEAEPEITEVVSSEPETTEPVVTEPETTPELTEPETTEPAGVRADESFIGNWHQDASNGIRIESVQNDTIEFNVFGQIIHYMSGTATFNGDRYYFNDDVDLINPVPELSGMPVSGYLMFTGEELIVYATQGDYSQLVECKYLITNINPSLGNDFITGTYEQVCERFPEYPIPLSDDEHGDITTHVTFNDDMTIYFDVYSDEGLVRINGKYELMQAKEDPIFDAEIEKMHILNGDEYVAVVTINEDDLGTVKMPSKFYFRIYNKCVYLQMFDSDYSISWGESAIVISGAYDIPTFARFIEDSSYHQIGRVVH